MNSISAMKIMLIMITMTMMTMILTDNDDKTIKTMPMLMEMITATMAVIREMIPSQNNSSYGNHVYDNDNSNNNDNVDSCIPDFLLSFECHCILQNYEKRTLMNSQINSLSQRNVSNNH